MKATTIGDTRTQTKGKLFFVIQEQESRKEWKSRTEAKAQAEKVFQFSELGRPNCIIQNEVETFQVNVAKKNKA